MTQRTEHAQTYPTSQADLARRRGVNRSTVSRHLQPGGLLRSALLPGGRVDLAHPAVRAWLNEALPADFAERAGLGVRHDVLMREIALTLEQLATKTGVPPEELRTALEGPLATAVVAPGHVAADEFAARAEVPVRLVVAAARGGELANALLPGGRLDLGHPAALAFMAARPFRRDKTGDPICPDIGGRGFLVPALVGEDIDLDHPVARCWCARVGLTD
jgi:hypothetical protein